MFYANIRLSNRISITERGFTLTYSIGLLSFKLKQTQYTASITQFNLTMCKVNNVGCLFSASFDHRKTLSASDNEALRHYSHMNNIINSRAQYTTLSLYIYLPPSPSLPPPLSLSLSLSIYLSLPLSLPLSLSLSLSLSIYLCLSPSLCQCVCFSRRSKLTMNKILTNRSRDLLLQS